MGKYGKHRTIDLNPLHYNIGLLGESGVGKSTICKEICEKLVGRDGYLALDIGREDGHKAINDINSETIEDWAKFADVVDDIVENKETDYPELKVVVIDTYDELCYLAEKEVIRLSKKAGKPADSINAAFGGYGRGQEKVIDLILDKLWELKSVGVCFIVVAHVKRTDVDDVMSEEKYTILTASTSQKYFNAIKNKLDFLGMAYIDRDIVKEKTGKKGFDGKEKVRGKVSGESRIINFRDDSYSLDSKCRFNQIVDRVPFNADAFIKAMKDAMQKEAEKSGKSPDELEAIQKEKEAELEKTYREASMKAKEEADEKENAASYFEKIQNGFTSASMETKNQAKEILMNAGFAKFSDPEIPAVVLKEIAALF